MALRTVVPDVVLKVKEGGKGREGRERGEGEGGGRGEAQCQVFGTRASQITAWP